MIFIKVTQTETNCVRGQTNMRPPFLIKKDLEKNKDLPQKQAIRPTRFTHKIFPLPRHHQSKVLYSSIPYEVAQRK